MHADHEQWRDSAAAYLLRALPEDELQAYEAHLAGCAICREEIDELTPAVEALPSSVDPVAPPAALKARVMADVEREAALLAAAGPAADRPARPRRRPRFSFAALRPAPVLAALALLLVGAAAGIGIAGLGGDDARTFTAEVDRARAPRAGVQVELDGGEATLVARGLPAPPQGRVYQVWLKRPGRAPEPTSALFTPSRDGTATTSVPGPVDDVEQVLVTDEPFGGSRVPSRKPFVVASIS